MRSGFCNPFRVFGENCFETSRGTWHTAKAFRTYGVYPLHSRFNHSCIPNSKVPTTTMGETIAIVATQDITVGEEITFCYSPDFSARTSHSRRQQLRFVCKCKACLQGTPFQQLSDIRRTLIRGLYYLAFDKGLDGETQTEALSIIFDTKLKSEVENSTIPLSKRFVSALLAMFLLEEEGLLDNLRIKDIYPSVLEMKDMFRTEANAKHSLLAVSQETWLEKFIVAARMYGRTDSVDRHYNAALRAKT